MVKTMFNFLRNKKKKPWLRFFSLEPGLVENYPLIPTSSVRRRWQSKEERNKKCPFRGNMNVANCPGLKQITRMGYVVVAPMDFIIRTNGDGVGYEYEIPTMFTRHANFVGDHPPDQTVPLVDSPRESLAHIIKLETPWRVRASDDVIFMQTPVYWNNESRFEATAGIYDPRFAMQVNVQLIWHVLDGETLVKAGTPLAQFIPMPRATLDKSWYDIRIDNATTEDWDLENAFNYSLKAEYPNDDDVSHKVARAMRAIKHHSNGIDR